MARKKRTAEHATSSPRRGNKSAAAACRSEWVREEKTVPRKFQSPIPQDRERWRVPYGALTQKRKVHRGKNRGGLSRPHCTPLENGECRNKKKQALLTSRKYVSRERCSSSLSTENWSTAILVDSLGECMKSLEFSTCAEQTFVSPFTSHMWFRKAKDEKSCKPT